MDDISKTDKEITGTILHELKRQQEGIELIPSENYVSKAVLQAGGSIFTNKYSEGYPKKRYYGGQEYVDEMEEIAIDRAKKLFGAPHANVQAYSGSPANQAVFFALLELKDKFMGLSLTDGGHLTHGLKVNFSGSNYRCIPYGVDKETEMLDMDEIKKIALNEHPKMIISGLTAYPRKIPFKEFHEICLEIDAYHLADVAHIAGLIAGGVHENPFPNVDVVTTTTHKSLRGPRGALILSQVDDRLKEKYHPESKWNLSQLIDRAVFPGLQGGPHDNVNAAKAVALKEALEPDFKDYAKQIVKNAKALAEELMDNGLRLVTGGTDNHLILIDVAHSGLVGKGPEVQEALDAANITTNKNTIPNEPNTPFRPSGIRLGTPAITTRGMKESEMKVIGKAISEIIVKKMDVDVVNKQKQVILELTKEFPLYPDMDILK
jgi:glycine hydroxymethyltransferase